MFCTSCGTQLPDEANFCWKCGHPMQKNLQGKTDLQHEKPKWEICEIDCKAVKESGLLNAGQAQWLAKVTGTKGTYYVGESPTFYVTRALVRRNISRSKFW